MSSAVLDFRECGNSALRVGELLLEITVMLHESPDFSILKFQSHTPPKLRNLTFDVATLFNKHRTQRSRRQAPVGDPSGRGFVELYSCRILSGSAIEILRVLFVGCPTYCFSSCLLSLLGFGFLHRTSKSAHPALSEATFYLCKVFRHKLRQNPRMALCPAATWSYS